MTTYSVFRPTVVVHDDGRIEVDLADSFEATYNAAGPVADDATHAQFLDSILAVGQFPPWQSLGRLAYYLENPTAFQALWNTGATQRTDDESVPGFARPFHTHPHIRERGDTGHAHPGGGAPHSHQPPATVPDPPIAETIEG